MAFAQALSVTGKRKPAQDKRGKGWARLTSILRSHLERKAVSVRSTRVERAIEVACAVQNQITRKLVRATEVPKDVLFVFAITNWSH